MYDQLEAWYDGHLEAGFGEIDAEVRTRRRGLMGIGIEVLVNGRDPGTRLKRHIVRNAGAGWILKVFGSGRCMG